MNNIKQYGLLIAIVAISVGQSNAMFRSKITQLKTLMPFCVKTLFKSRSFCSKKNNKPNLIKELVSSKINKKVTCRKRSDLETKLHWDRAWYYLKMKYDSFLPSENKNLEAISLNKAEKDSLIKRALSGNPLSKNQKKDLLQKARDEDMGKIIKCYQPGKNKKYFSDLKSNTSKCCSQISKVKKNYSFIDNFFEPFDRHISFGRIDCCAPCIKNILKEYYKNKK